MVFITSVKLLVLIKFRQHKQNILKCLEKSRLFGDSGRSFFAFFDFPKEKYIIGMKSAKTARLYVLDSRYNLSKKVIETAVLDILFPTNLRKSFIIIQVVMNYCVCHCEVCDDLALLVDLDMIFVSVMSLLSLLCPAGIRVLLYKLVHTLFIVSLPFIRDLAFLYCFVLIVRVPLARGFGKGRIHKASLACHYANRVHFSYKHVKQFFLSVAFRQ